MDKKAEAFKDWKKGVKYKDIADKYGVSLSTVKSWASRYWKKEGCNQNKKKVATSNKKLQPKGAPKGNKNAVGNSGGAPEGNKNNYKHGIYEQVYWDTLDEEEKALIFDMQFEEEQSLIDQIRLLTVRERRLMMSIAKNKEAKGGLALDSVVKRKLEIKGNIIEDDNQIQEETTTRTISTFEVLMKLEAELTRVQSKKTRCIEALNKIRTERKKLEEGENGNDLVDDWISAVTGGEDNS
ncbi:helix-turn-helix domain-containing protein [Anaerovorax sp. IOR16]|uniref:helix-turn-helix domain-containing protein n=1 Tax=Anaerovorax sp. IOR16 TaxID=2773458 RepID=UPI0019D31A15